MNIKDVRIAKEILQQLGGNKFIAMTGAKQFVAGKNEMSFRIPGGHFTKQGINHVKIKLTEMDVYDVTFGKIRKFEYKEVKKVKGLYFDQLQEVFTQVTGLNTHL
jgi:hypothetical protein